MYRLENIRAAEKEKLDFSYPKHIEEIREAIFASGRYDPADRFYYALGGAVLAPLYVGFCAWAIETALREGIRKIFPLMREGILYDKILRVMIGAGKLDLQSVPLWVSRKSSYGALCYGQFDYDFFLEMCKGYPSTIEGCFQKMVIAEQAAIYAGQETQLDDAIQREDTAPLRTVYEEILRRHLDEPINRWIDSTKRLMGAYLAQCGATEDFATLDVGSMGTLPQAIDNCTDAARKRIHLFLVAQPPALPRIRRGHDIRFVFGDFSVPCIFSAFSFHLIETMAMGNCREGTATGYRMGEDGRVRVVNAPGGFRDAEMRRTVSIVQEGIVDFARLYMEEGARGDLGQCDDLARNGAKSLFRLVQFPLPEEARGIGFYAYDESAKGTSVNFIHANLLSEGGATEKLPEGDIDLRMEAGRKNASAWAEGALLLHAERIRKKSEAGQGLRNIAIYGFGFYGKRALEAILPYKVRVVCIIDRKMAGGVFETIPIIAVEDLRAYDVTDVIVGSYDFKEEINAILDKCARAWGKKYVVHNIVV